MSKSYQQIIFTESDNYRREEWPGPGTTRAGMNGTALIGSIYITDRN